MRAQRRSLVRAILAAVLTVHAVASPMVAQEESQRPGTHARKGLAIGAIAGGLVGGVSFALLGLGGCESSNCGTDTFKLAMLGAVTGAAGGGLTGLALGAVIPRRPEGETAPAPTDAVPGTPSSWDVTRPGSYWWAVLSLGPTAGADGASPGRAPRAEPPAQPRPR